MNCDRNQRIKELDDLQKLAQEYFRNQREVLGHSIASDKVVLYTGNPCADVIAIGRDLGSDEILKSEVLVGPAGQRFRKTVKKLKMDPLEDFFLCNTVPLRPANNRAFPKDVRVFARPLLKEIITIVDPLIILTLGQEATQEIVKVEATITKVAGNIYREDMLGRNRAIVPAIHPSYILRGVPQEVERQLFIQPILIVRHLLKYMR